MNTLLTLCLGLTLPLGIAATANAAPLPQQESAKLRYSTVKKWEIALPGEEWLNIGRELPIAHAKGTGFDAWSEMHKLRVDTNGDGGLDDKVVGLSGRLTLYLPQENGKTARYAIRLRNYLGSWKYACSGIRKGKIHDVAITLIDLNGNGLWNEAGKDAMVVGKRQSASYLSEVINLKGELFSFEATADGSLMTITPYRGETGVLDAFTAFNAEGTLTQAVFSTRQKRISFDLAQSDEPLLVPATRYYLSSGQVEQGIESARIRRGRMRQVKVRANANRIVNWGGPLRMEPETVRPDSEKTMVMYPAFLGSADEEYFDFKPGGKESTLQLQVTDQETGEELWSGGFCVN